MLLAACSACKRPKGSPHPALWTQDPFLQLRCCGGAFAGYGLVRIVPVEVEGQYTFTHPCAWQLPIQRH